MGGDLRASSMFMPRNRAAASLDFPPKGLIVLGIADVGRDPADDDVRNLGLELGAYGEGEASELSLPII